MRALHGAISRGTEALIAAGRVPDSEFERMRAPFMAGAFPFPVKYGYATVGRVEAGPPDLLGRNVFALHPHQTLFDVPAEAAVPVPEDVPAARAVLAANMETALNAAGMRRPGRTAASPWSAPAWSARWSASSARASTDADVTLVDINPHARRTRARTRRQFAAPDAAPADCDFVVHASATAAGLATALNARRATRPRSSS